MFFNVQGSFANFYVNITIIAKKATQALRDLAASKVKKLSALKPC
jgi:hypothetical protein